MSDWQWQCPDCHRINVYDEYWERFKDSESVQCSHCQVDHTTDWDKYLTDRFECGGCNAIMESDFSYCPKCGQGIGDW